MYAPIFIRNAEFPENYQLLLGDYKRLIGEYNHLVAKLESLENEIGRYKHKTNPAHFELATFFP